MEIARHIDVRGWGLEKLHPQRKCSEPKELSVYACTVVSFVSLLHLCLWRDVWNAVSSIYYHVLHNVEEDSPLEPANGTHLFCARHVFVPRIQEDLDTFTDGWNTHSLGMEHYLTSNQLWEMGMIQSPVSLLEGKKNSFAIRFYSPLCRYWHILAHDPFGVFSFVLILFKLGHILYGS